MSLFPIIFLLLLLVSSSVSDTDVLRATLDVPSLRGRNNKKENKRHKHSNSVISMGPFVFPQLYKCINESVARVVMTSRFEFKSQSREDVWLWENVFRNLPLNETLGGTFLEIGAFKGVKLSNTYFFEKKLDWRGILIEGHPSNDIRSAQTERPNSAIFTVAICPALHGTPGNLTFTGNGGPTGAALGQSSEIFMKNWHKNDGAGLVVACIPIQSIIESTGLYDIDLFTLDVEGGELSVLQTLDFEATNIRVMMVELDGTNEQKDESIRSLLLSKGFLPSKTSVRTSCKSEKGCMKNEVFFNGQYNLRKRSRQNYIYGTGVKC